MKLKLENKNSRKNAYITNLFFETSGLDSERYLVKEIKLSNKQVNS
ncbi:TPA: hypothetical protein STX52_000984 [Clostridioides difficile]|nr:hypothetical protein [Clostridioides difficile]